jgi:ribosomal protein L37AE/L43A
MSKLISENKTSRAWLLMRVGDDIRYGSNLGYDGEISKMYCYDSTVQKAGQVMEGDLVLLRDRNQLLGMAKIQSIESFNSEKELFVCPNCLRRLKHPKRKKEKPSWLCSICKYEFDEPIKKYKDCVKFTAYFGDTFVATQGAIDVEILKQACQKHNPQHSINSIDLAQIQSILLKNVPTVAKLINYNNDSQYIKGDESFESEYIISPEDRREIVFRQIKERRGQSQFRDLLRQRYGNQCMITGLKLLDVLEAAHISPYRGTDDNHPDNGLLLRADLHTLFDLNLLGINPESLEVKFHPKVLKTGYQKLEGRKLICSQYKPSQSALQYRWKEFLTRLDEDY